MPRQVATRIGLARESVGEAAAVVNVGRGIWGPREREAGANVERVALIMVERAKPWARIAQIRGEIRQAASDGAAGVCDLVRIGKMKLGAMGNARRTQCKFPSSNKSLLNSEREEKIGFSNRVVVEEIIRAGAKGIGVEHPSAERNSDPEWVF